MSPAKKINNHGFSYLLIAIGIGGLSGYLLAILTGVRLGPSDYASFSVFWSFLFLLVNAFSGVQQEVTRAVQPLSKSSRPKNEHLARNLLITLTISVVALIFAAGPLIANFVFKFDGWILVFPLAFGLVAYLFAAVLSGIFAGISSWKLLATTITVDSLLRLILVGLVVTISHDVTIISWAVVVPFALTPSIIWLIFRHQIINKYNFDSKNKKILWNIVRTVTGAAATGILISGFPSLLSITSPNDSTTDLATLIFFLNLARAPIVIIALSLQGYMVVKFRGIALHLLRTVMLYIGTVIVVSLLLGFLFLLFGTQIFQLFFGDKYAMDSLIIAALVASAGVIGAQCISGSAALARGKHGFYTIGWVISAVGTILFLVFIPGNLYSRTLFALTFPPMLGTLIHLSSLVLKSYPPKDRLLP